MIQITNNQGVNLELFSNQPLITEQAAAWLVDDELPAEYSYPIDAPLTENNERFVSHGYRPDSATPRQVMPVTVSLGGVLYRRALMAFKRQGGKLNIALKIDSAEAYDKLRRVSLLEALKTPVLIGDGLVGSVNGIAQIMPLYERLGQIAIAPIGSFPAAFFPIRNELFFEEDWATKVPGAVPGPQPYVNLFTRTADGVNRFVADSTFGDGVLRGFPICPQLHLWWVLEQLMQLAGFRIESDWLAQESIQRLCILNMTALPPHNATFDQLLGGHFFIPGQCLPDMAVSEFLKAIKGRFGLCFTFNANTRICHIAQFSQSVAKGPAVNLTPFQSGDYDAADPLGTGFAVKELIDSQDELYKDAGGKLIEPAPLIVGKGATEINLKVGSCQSIYLESGLTPSGRWQVPTVRQAGNLLEPAYKASERYVDETGNRRNAIALRLVSYEGMQPDSTGALYPFASTERCDLAGRNGIWRNGLRQYFYFRDQSRAVVQKLLLPADRLSGLQLHRSASLSLNDMIRRSYLITKLRSQAPGPSGLLVVEATVQTLPGGIDQPADVDEPYVYVELLQETQTDILGPYSDTINGNSYDLTKLTVKVWADRNKTQAAVVTKLPVRLRLLKTWPKTYADKSQLDNGLPRTQFYQETINTYLIDGSQTVIETALKTHLFYTGVGIWDHYDIKVQLDPAEGYGIL